jgi:Rieske 2Fe-2S family protein
MEQVQTKFHGKNDRLQSRIDLRHIISPENYAVEREKIFRRSWLAIAHTDDVPKKGSYFVFEMPTFGASLIVVRGQDDNVRVFHNACRHRGNKLTRGGSGCTKTFTCNFHGWVFTTEGALQVVTDEHQFESIDKAQYGLKEVTSEVWENFVFVNFDDQPRQTLREWLGAEFYERYGGGYFDRHENVATYSFVLNCNWHLGVNSFTEGYHTRFLHKNTARDYQGGKANKERQRPYMELTPRHHRYSAPANPEHHILPMEELACRYGRKILPAFDTTPATLASLPSGVNPGKFDNWAFDVIGLYPNFVLMTGAHFRAEMWFWPIDAGRTLFVNRAYNYRAKNLGERLSRDYFRGRARDVVREDLNTLEAQQQIIESGALDHVILSRQEMALQHHYAVTERMMAVE